MYKTFLNKIKEFSTIIIHRHTRPDGDAIGSQIGLKEAIKENFPNKNVLVVGDTNNKFAFVGTMDTVKDEEYINALAIILDSAEPHLISDDRYTKAKYVIKIDHHLSTNNYGDLNIVDTDEISCASLVTKILLKNNMKLNNFSAQALFTGIVTDSGRFRYDGVNSDTFTIASKLLEYNFDMASIYNNLYTEDIQIVKLRAQLTLNFQISKNSVAYLKNTQEDIKKYNTDVFTISRGMVNVMAGIKGIDIWVNFTEDDNHKILAEIRSNKYNINPVAVKYGGGGHKMASGATLDSFEVADEMIKDLEKIVEESDE